MSDLTETSCNCISCEECGAEDSMEVEMGVTEKCPDSERPCGHHCNHIWSHDKCCWCGIEVVDLQVINEDERSL